MLSLLKKLCARLRCARKGHEVSVVRLSLDETATKKKDKVIIEHECIHCGHQDANTMRELHELRKRRIKKPRKRLT